MQRRSRRKSNPTFGTATHRLVRNEARSGARPQCFASREQAGSCAGEGPAVIQSSSEEQQAGDPGKRENDIGRRLATANYSAMQDRKSSVYDAEVNDKWERRADPTSLSTLWALPFASRTRSTL